MLFQSLTLIEWLLSTIIAAYYVYRHFARNSMLKKVPGPKSDSFIYGNLPKLFQEEAGKLEFEWYSEYGPIVRVSGPLGRPVLVVSDPKVIHRIFQAGGYKYPRPRIRRLFGRVFSGRQVFSLEYSDHRRLRKVMQPGFGASETRALLPIFTATAQKMTRKWTELLNASSDESVVLDLTTWTSRATLDAMGIAAFDYEIGALNDADNFISKAYRNLFFHIFSKPSDHAILTMGLLDYLPTSFVHWFFGRIRAPRIMRARDIFLKTRSVAKMLYEEKKSSVAIGEHNKDVMSLIVKANVSENPNSRLSDEEMYALMQLVLLAGHETTANTIGWTALELSKHPEAQHKLRKEIHATEEKIRERGDTDLTTQDLDSMPYLNAVVKEILRLHPAVPLMQRTADVDNILPLSKPLVLTNGQTVTELLIPKGTLVLTSVAAYNRTPEIFGEDAHDFNPDRWQNEDDIKKKGTYVGVYSNLLTFSGGIKSCIGWRFAVLELQAFLFRMFGNFEISLAVPAEKIIREVSTVMLPVLEGETEKGVQLPVKIKLAPREE